MFTFFLILGLINLFFTIYNGVRAVKTNSVSLVFRTVLSATAVLVCFFSCVINL